MPMYPQVTVGIRRFVKCSNNNSIKAGKFKLSEYGEGLRADAYGNSFPFTCHFSQTQSDCFFPYFSLETPCLGNH